MREITTEEGDALIRASWPPRRAAVQDINYEAHTSECGNCGAEEDEPKPRHWLRIAALVVSCALLGWALVAGMRMAGMLP
jgi:hypothetical protein